MGDEWRFSRNGKQGGPVSLGELKRMAAAGQLSPNDQLWKQGMPKWIRADSVEGLFPATEVVQGVVLVEDSDEFAGRLAKVKRKRDQALQDAMARGARNAEKAFPDIVEDIEKSATKGCCQWRAKVKLEMLPALDNTMSAYLMGYIDRMGQLSKNSGFTFELAGQGTEGENVFAQIVIKW